MYDLVLCDIRVHQPCCMDFHVKESIFFISFHSLFTRYKQLVCSKSYDLNEIYVKERIVCKIHVSMVLKGRAY